MLVAAPQEYAENHSTRRLAGQKRARRFHLARLHLPLYPTHAHLRDFTHPFGIFNHINQRHLGESSAAGYPRLRGLASASAARLQLAVLS